MITLKAALNNIRVIEIGHFIAAPYCAQMLADLGAEVIKIERPKSGEAARTFGPYHNEESLYYTSYNRNKKGITLDLKSEKGKEIFIDLVKQSDVVIENQRPGLMRSMGLSYEELSQINPRIIMASISGYGQTGPYKDWPALDMIIQAIGGVMSMTGFPDSPPTKAGFALVDFSTAIYTALGITTALIARNNTGKGQFVDVAMLDSIFTFLENFPATYLLDGFIPPRVGNQRVVTGPSNAYATQDGYLYIAAVADNHFKILMKTIGNEELANDPRFETSLLRKQSQDYLDKIIGEWVKQFNTNEIFELLSEKNVPCAPVKDISQLVHDPQIREREMIIELEHPNIKKLPMIGNPIKLSDTPCVYRSAPPTLGQHTREIFSSLLSFDEEKINSLKEEKVI